MKSVLELEFHTRAAPNGSGVSRARLLARWLQACVRHDLWW